MLIITSIFNHTTKAGKSRGDYQLLYDTFIKSVNRNFPAAELRTLYLNPPEGQFKASNVCHYDNTAKLEAFNDIVQTTEEPIVFMDCDMLILKPFPEIFQLTADVAFTYRTRGNIPINGGFMFVGPTKQGKAFFDRMTQTNRDMSLKPALHKMYRQYYHGINQSAIGKEIEDDRNRTNIEFLPCRIYNACTEDWTDIGSHTKVLHVKSKLKRACLGMNKTRRVNPELQTAVNVWNTYRTIKKQSA